MWILYFENRCSKTYTKKITVMQNLIFMGFTELIGLDLCIVLASYDHCAFNPVLLFLCNLCLLL